MTIGQIVSLQAENLSRTDAAGQRNSGSSDQNKDLALALSQGYDMARGLIHVVACSPEDWQQGVNEIVPDVEALKFVIDETKHSVTNDLQLLMKNQLYGDTAPKQCYKVVTGHRRISTWLQAQCLRKLQNEAVETTLSVMVVKGNAAELMELNISENEVKTLGVLPTTWGQKINNAQVLFKQDLIQADFRRIYGHGTGTKIFMACKVLSLLGDEAKNVDISLAKSWDKEALRSFAAELETANADAANATPDDKPLMEAATRSKGHKITEALKVAPIKTKSIAAKDLKEIMPSLHPLARQVLELFSVGNVEGLKGWKPVLPTTKPTPVPAKVAPAKGKGKTKK